MLNALMWLRWQQPESERTLLRSMPAWSLNICTWIKEISIDKILNKTKRKKVEKLETESMEIFAPINLLAFGQHEESPA